MSDKWIESLVEKTCLIAFFIILAAYKNNINWRLHPQSRTVFWTLSDYLAKSILISALMLSFYGFLIVAGRLRRFLIAKPTVATTKESIRRFMKEPCEPTPWINFFYSILGFLSFGIPIRTLALAGLLGAFFSATVRHTLRKQHFRNVVRAFK